MWIMTFRAERVYRHARKRVRKQFAWVGILIYYIGLCQCLLSIISSIQPLCGCFAALLSHCVKIVYTASKQSEY